MKYSSIFLLPFLLNYTNAFNTLFFYFLSLPKGLSLSTQSTTVLILATYFRPISCNYQSWFSLPILAVLLFPALLFPECVSLQIIYIAHHTLSILLLSLSFFLNHIVSIHYLWVSSLALLLSYVFSPLLRHKYPLSLSNESKFDKCYIYASLMLDKIISFLRQAI